MGKEAAKTASKGSTALGAGIAAVGGPLGVAFGGGMAIGEGISLIAIAVVYESSAEPGLAFEDLVTLPPGEPPSIPGSGRMTRIVNRLGERGFNWLTKARLLRGTVAKLQGAASEQALEPVLRLHQEAMLLIEGVRVEQALFAMGLKDLRDAIAGDPIAEMRIGRKEILDEASRMLLTGEVLDYERFVFDALRPTQCEVAMMLNSVRTVLHDEVPETLSTTEALAMLAREIDGLEVRSALPDLPSVRDLVTFCRTLSETTKATLKRRAKADAEAPQFKGR